MPIHRSIPVFRQLVVALTLLAALSGAAWAQQTPAQMEARAKSLDNQFMAPCCGANVVAVHESGPAQRMRAEIRQLIAAGKTDAEIREHFVAEHGETILSAPRPSGFNLVAYLLPIALLVIIIPALFWFVVKRWKGATPQPAVAGAGAGAGATAGAVHASGGVAPASPEVSAKYADRVAAALREIDD